MNTQTMSDRERWFEEIFGDVPYRPDTTVISPEKKAFQSCYMDRLKQSVTDHEANRIDRTIYLNERMLAYSLFNLGRETLDGLTIDVALEQALGFERQGMPGQMKTWLDLSQALERRSSYEYRLF